MHFLFCFSSFSSFFFFFFNSKRIRSDSFLELFATLLYPISTLFPIFTYIHCPDFSGEKIWLKGDKVTIDAWTRGPIALKSSGKERKRGKRRKNEVGAIFDGRDRKRLLFKRGKGGEGVEKRGKKKEKKRKEKKNDRRTRKYSCTMKSLKITDFVAKGWFQKIPLRAHRATKISNGESLWPLGPRPGLNPCLLLCDFVEIFFSIFRKNNDTWRCLFSIEIFACIGNSSYVNLSKLGPNAI